MADERQTRPATHPKPARPTRPGLCGLPEQRTRNGTKMSVAASGSAVRALALEYKSLQEEPVEGFRVKLLGEDNLFEWEVAIFGPPDTLYQGGYFKVSLSAPSSRT